MIACVVFGAFGLLLGSFLNVCIVRLPVGESPAWPRSHCRQCNHPIAGWDNIPILSWLLLGAACRACEGRISWRYPLIELTTCVFFVLCCVQFSFSWQAACWGMLCFLLLGLAVMDAETFLLPDWFTLPGLAGGVVFAAFQGGAWGALFSLVAAAVAASILLLIAGLYWLARRRRGIGLGDVKLLAMLGAWFGLRQTALILFLAIIVGALYGLGMILAVNLIEHRGREESGENPLPAGQLPVPFGTMLSAAGLYAIFFGQRTLGWYMHFFR